jgi:hypothetical protein
MNPHVKRAIDLLGSQTKLAKACGSKLIPLHYSGHKFCRIIHQNLGVRK